MVSRRFLATAASGVFSLGLVMVAASPAQAADFCAGKIPGSTYYQKSFNYGGQVAATICAPISSGAGTAYLYARGPYNGPSKYMKLSVDTLGKGNNTVDGNFSSYCYTYRPAGNHNYHAIMYDGSGHKIVDGWGYDYE